MSSLRLFKKFLIFLYGAILLLFVGIILMINNATIRSQMPRTSSTVFADSYDDEQNTNTLTTVDYVIYEKTSDSPRTAQVKGYLSTMPNWTELTLQSSVTINGISGYIVTSIGSSAFSGCSALYKVNLPSCITSIEYSAFYNCPRLTDVFFNSEFPPSLGYYSFFTNYDSGGDDYCFEDGDDPSNTHIVVPSNYYNNYALNENWLSSSYVFDDYTEYCLADFVVVNGNYELEYSEVYDTNKCDVIGYSGYSTSITIPSSVIINGIQCDVCSITGDAFQGSLDHGQREITDIYISNPNIVLGDYSIFCYRYKIDKKWRTARASADDYKIHVPYELKDTFLSLAENEENGWETYLNYITWDEPSETGVIADIVLPGVIISVLCVALSYVTLSGRKKEI